MGGFVYCREFLYGEIRQEEGLKMEISRECQSRIWPISKKKIVPNLANFGRAASSLFGVLQCTGSRSLQQRPSGAKQMRLERAHHDADK